MPTLNTVISPAVVVSCLTKGLEVGASFTGNVTVSLSTNPTGATLGGTKTIAATAGVATFSDLTVNRSGKGFVMKAVGTGLRAAYSSPFSIATELTFTTQPVDTKPNTHIPTFTVKALDSASNIDTTYNGVITIAKYSGPGTMTGTASVTATSGAASFTDIEFDELGDYIIIARGEEIATAYPPAAATSNSFSISNGVTFSLTTSTVYVGGYGYYSPSQPFNTPQGSLSPTTYMGDDVGIVLSTDISSGLNSVQIAIAGTHGQTYFNSVTCNGVTLYTNLPPFYSFSHSIGYTIWEWRGVGGTFNLSPGTYSVVIA